MTCAYKEYESKMEMKQDCGGFFLLARMSIFSVSGRDSLSCPIPPVGNTLWVAFEKHALHTLLRGITISCKTCLLF